MTFHPSHRSVPRILASWAERSQQDACRNAMAASTALAEQRRERDEVAAYVETRDRPPLRHRPRTAPERTSALG